jgi:hypothetical protein
MKIPGKLSLALRSAPSTTVYNRHYNEQNSRKKFINKIMTHFRVEISVKNTFGMYIPIIREFSMNFP